MQTLILKHKIKYPNKYKFIVQSKLKSRNRNMVKQRICGVLLAICGVIPILIEKEVTTFVFLSIFFLPMIFGQRYIMTFKE